MSSFEQRAAVFNPFFEPVKGPRERVRREGKKVGDSMGAYRRAVAASEAATEAQLKAIDALGDDVPRLDKYVARLALRDTSVTDGLIPRQKKILREGIPIFDRIESVFQDDVKVIADIQDDAVTLFPANGPDDLVVDDYGFGSAAGPGNQRALQVQLKGGVKVVGETRFSRIIGTDKERRDTVINDLELYDKDPFKHARVWDPASKAYRLPFVRLGEQNGQLALKADSQRFALRTASMLTGNTEWLTAEAPREEYQHELIAAMAGTYWSLLAYGKPNDVRESPRPAWAKPSIPRPAGPPRHRGEPSRPVDPNRDVSPRSRASYKPAELAAIYYGADVSPADVQTATIETIERKAGEVHTAQQAYSVVRARRDVQAFFDTLPTSE